MNRIPQTQIESYHSIQDLGKKQYNVYAAVRMQDGATSCEIAELLGWQINCVVSRVNELVKLEYLEAGKPRLNKKTGKMNISWQVKIPETKNQMELL